MDIEPLCPELIAKLEIAVAHRNRERAAAVIEWYFDELDKPTLKLLDTAIADLLPMRQASLLARHNYFKIRDLKKTTQENLLEIKGLGQKTVQLLIEKIVGII
jgi:hypothetical protein